MKSLAFMGGNMSKKNLKVSIIMPVYNAEKHLRECIDSILNQSLRDIELICVNDGSIDNSLEILETYAQKDERLRIVNQPNSGAGVARNVGMKFAQGEYLAFFDCDDIFEYNMLEQMYDKAEKEDLDIVVCRSDALDDKTYKFEERTWTIRENLLPNSDVFSAQDISRDFFRLFVWWPWDKLYKTSFVKKSGIQFQGLRTTNDLFFVASCMLSARRISTIGSVLAHHRVNDKSSLSMTREASWWCFYKALIALRDFLIVSDNYNRFKIDFINYCLGFALWQVNSISGPAYFKLRAKLCNEWFDALGINDLPIDQFYAQNEYQDKVKLERMHKAFEKSQVLCRPKVTIVLPCLNSEEYLAECIESIMNQTLTDIEIICVDAGSTDATLDILNQYSQIDNRIRILHSTQKSYGHQVNLGIAEAHGEYLAIVESDDYIDREMYQSLYTVAKENDLEVCKSDFCRFYGEGEKRIFEYAQVYKNQELYDVVLNPQEDLNLFHIYVLITPCIYSLDFIRNKCIHLNETLGASYQDNGFWFQVLMNAKRILLYPKAFYMLRRDNPNSSVKSKSKVYAMCVEYDFIYDLFKDDPEALKKYAPICARLRFNNYNFTLSRISELFKLDFVLKYASDFKEIYERGELEPSYFSKNEWNKLEILIKDPIKFYCLFVKQEDCKPAIFKSREYKDLQDKYVKLLFDFKSMRESVSFRMGRKITCIPRKLRDYLRH